MKNDQKLKHDVEQALKWEPLLINTAIGVITQDGIITLIGSVDSYAKKRVAEQATKTVKGVKAVIEKIEVTFADKEKKSDSVLAQDVLDVLKFNPIVPENQIQIQVENGWVTLEGTVKLNFQKLAALTCVEHIPGIRAVANLITIKSEFDDQVEKIGIQDALIRNWTIDEKCIKVDVFGNCVTLTGFVDSIFQKEEAERMAWSAPGVWNVHNDLFIN